MHSGCEKKTRRWFVGNSLAALGGACGLGAASGGKTQARSSEERTQALGSSFLESIERSVLWNGRKGGGTWFHPRVCMAPNPNDPAAPIALMTLQKITGSDVYGQVHWSASEDLGRTWSDPEPIAAFARRDVGGGMEEGVCDVVPQYHAPTGTVLAMGHNVYYRADRLTQPAEERWPVYAVRSADGKWSGARKLEWDDPRATAIYSCGCGERLVMEGGDILVPLSFGPLGRKDRAVGSARCSFDGNRLEVKASGNELRNPADRGLLEPSLVRFGGRYLMTIRAEDGRGYVSVSLDGLNWEEQRPWSWEDGEPLGMSTTQQHWLPHAERLHLVYTRRAEGNVNVMRWRAPLYVAEVDAENLRLIRSSEQVVLPLIGDGVEGADHVARMGNFHTTAATPGESWVTVGEILPNDGWRGDVLMARLR